MACDKMQQIVNGIGETLVAFDIGKLRKKLYLLLMRQVLIKNLFDFLICLLAGHGICFVFARLYWPSLTDIGKWISHFFNIT
jgi:hypothetical protein